MTTATITSAEQVALGALDDLLRVERLLAKKRLAYEQAVSRLADVTIEDPDGVILARYAAASQEKITAASERLEADRLTRWAP